MSSRRPHRVLSRRAAAFAIALALTLAGCAAAPAASPDSPASPASPDGASAARTLTVFAAASLTETFTTLADDFEAANPGVTVHLVFDGSSGLAAQLTEGAPVDVFASANTSTMQTVIGAGLANGPQAFAANLLEIATPPGNPAGIAGFADLAAPGMRLVVCAPEVPCGAATQRIEATAGVTLSPMSEENSVTDVLGKVTSGEADAGLVYATDVIAAGAAVTGIPFPEASGAVNEYPIVALSRAREPGLAADFVTFVLSDRAQQALRAAGFRPAS